MVIHIDKPQEKNARRLGVIKVSTSVVSHLLGVSYPLEEFDGEMLLRKLLFPEEYVYVEHELDILNNLVRIYVTHQDLPEASSTLDKFTAPMVVATYWRDDRGNTGIDKIEIIPCMR